MMTMKMREDIIKCDFLIVGGGIAGMQAAITGSALGMDVVVAEKADTRRSGSGATGNEFTVVLFRIRQPFFNACFVNKGFWS